MLSLHDNTNRDPRIPHHTQLAVLVYPETTSPYNKSDRSEGLQSMIKTGLICCLNQLNDAFNIEF